MQPPVQLLDLRELLLLQPRWVLLLAAVGLFRAAKLFVSSLRWAYAYFLRPPRDLKKSYGSWALVTGPTDGIGKATAFRLAGEGLNLVLVGRNPGKLAAVSASLLAAHPEIRLETVVLDFAGGDTSEGIRRVGELAEELDLGLVVNNAGVAFPRPMMFHEVEERTWMEVVKVNLEGPTAVIRAVLPAMRRRRRGAVVNVGSASAGVLPSFPFFSTYAATKAYVRMLSKSLNLEYRDSGIIVQCQVPFVVATKIVGGLIPNIYHWFLASATDTYSRASIRWIGYDPWCVPCWQHFIQSCLIWPVPETLMDMWMAAVTGSQRA